MFKSPWFVLNGQPIEPLEISGVHGNRIHKFDAPVGNLKVDYAATIGGQTDPAAVTEFDLSMYLRPSRYAEADKFHGFATTEFGTYGDSARLLEVVSSSWVGARPNYVPGSSDPIDGAVDTLLAPRYRDYAHLVVVVLLRAVKVPAPGVGLRAGRVLDGLPRGGRGFCRWAMAGSRCEAAGATAKLGAHHHRRDAADTAFLDNHKGAVTLNKLGVTAVVDGDLPQHSIDQLLSIR